MINSLKTIAVFGSNFSGIYRYSLTKAFDKAAAEIGMNLVYINFIGRAGSYADHEFDLLDHIVLDRFDGIVYDGEGYDLPNMADAIIEKLRTAKCPVVSISTFVEGFLNVRFDDLYGFRQVVEHFLDHHKFTKIGYMSGLPSHPDAIGRREEFRRIMRERGLPEDGVGTFIGDFWFEKGKEAVDYFLSLPERPEAIVCANDYMAISLVTEFKKRGFRIPEDFAISGFDGTADGQVRMLPHLTTASREQYTLAVNVLTALNKLIDGEETDTNIVVRAKPIISHSCGCRKLDYRMESCQIDEAYDFTREINYHLLDTEASLLRLNQVDSLEKMEGVFKHLGRNFGDYFSFFLMLYVDSEGRLSCDSDFTEPSGRFTPVIWIDRKDEYIRPEGCLERGDIIPAANSDTPHSYFLTAVHTPEHIFGYSAIEMNNDGRSREFFILWLMILASALENLQKNDRINKLIGSLENKSLSDDLTGMLNRRGFYDNAKKALRKARGGTVCTFVIDMDGLKKINDAYGHHEGDDAIKTEAAMISACCTNGEIAARTGGDEFYIFASNYSEKKAQEFKMRLWAMTEEYNAGSGKPYKIGLSCGHCTAPGKNAILDELLKISDQRMYEQKKKKKLNVRLNSQGNVDLFGE